MSERSFIMKTRSVMPRITAQREEATRQAILRAARDTFVMKGFHEATTHDVARAAGLSVGSIYTYFASKDHLIRECVLAANKAESDAVLQDLRSDGSVGKRMSRAIAGWYRFTVLAPGVTTFLAEAWASASRKPLIRDMVAQRRERIATVAAVVLREGVAAGELPPDFDVETTARAVGALLDGVVIECISSPVAPTSSDVQRRALLLIGSPDRRR
jgi:AcrR family transcriptional regulator